MRCSGHFRKAHPHPSNQNSAEEDITANIIFNLAHLGFIDYNNLQSESKDVLSDSGTISEESSILKFRALNIRETHERPEAMEEAAVMMVGLKKEKILQALEFVKHQDSNTIRYVEDYMIPNVSEKVIRAIISYTDYVNRKVWKK